jgi:hypothetical protein
MLPSLKPYVLSGFVVLGMVLGMASCLPRANSRWKMMQLKFFSLLVLQVPVTKTK